jgi:hypothetical protein
MGVDGTIDLDGDGKVEDSELELYERRLKAQKRMAYTSLWSMILFTALLFSPIIPVERVNALSDLLGLFYIGQAGVVGAYMGFSAYMTK